MPTPISLAHRLALKLSEVRKNGTMAYLRPDGKSQVTVEYDANNKPVRVDAIVISTQHAETVGNDELRGDILKNVIQAVIPAELSTRTRSTTSIRLVASWSVDRWVTPA
jgi:S-adenosylmethionine synthetase